MIMNHAFEDRIVYELQMDLVKVQSQQNKDNADDIIALAMQTKENAKQ